jgi:hypothetical protein
MSQVYLQNLSIQKVVLEPLTIGHNSLQKLHCTEAENLNNGNVGTSIILYRYITPPQRKIFCAK